MLPQSPEAGSEIIPVLIRDRLLSHFLEQRLEVAQRSDGSSRVAIEPSDVLAGATQKQGPLDLLQGEALTVESSGQLAVRGGERALDAWGLEQQTGKLIDVLRFARLRLLGGGPPVRPESLADSDSSLLVLVAGEGELTKIAGAFSRDVLSRRITQSSLHSDGRWAEVSYA